MLGFLGLLHLVSRIQCNLDLVTLHIGTIGDLVAILKNITFQFSAYNPKKSLNLCSDIVRFIDTTSRVHCTLVTFRGPCPSSEDELELLDEVDS